MPLLPICLPCLNMNKDHALDLDFRRRLWLMANRRAQ
jgi:hypothetical protein